MNHKLTWPKWPIADENTWLRVKEVLESGRWAISGASTGAPSQEHKFATEFAKWNGVKHCVTVDHGSTALVSAIEALDLGYGDEVIVPGMTWVAPVLAVLSVNATPVVVDVEPDTFCLSVEKAKAAITSKTRAILPVHLYGCMVDMDGILALAEKHDLYVVEDAAHSHGSQWKGKNAGTMGDLGIFSMQQGKVLTSGEGGAVVTDDDTFKERVELSAWNARRRLDPGSVKPGNLQLAELTTARYGTNRCLSEFQAAILLDQLPRLEGQNRKREKNAQWLDAKLAEIPGLSPMRRLPQINKQTYYGYTIRVDSKVFGIDALSAIPRLREILGMGDFLLHAAYKPLSNNPLYAPHPKMHAITDAYRAALKVSDLKLPVAESGYLNSIVFHHSMLLGEEQHMQAVVDGFKTLTRTAKS